MYINALKLTYTFYVQASPRFVFYINTCDFGSHFCFFLPVVVNVDTLICIFAILGTVNWDSGGVSVFTLPTWELLSLIRWICLWILQGSGLIRFLMIGFVIFSRSICSILVFITLWWNYIFQMH